MLTSLKDIHGTPGLSRLHSSGTAVLALSCEVDAKPLERYREGGYCPTHLGTLGNGRYKILHELGWGGLPEECTKDIPPTAAIGTYSSSFFYGRAIDIIVYSTALCPILTPSRLRSRAKFSRRLIAQNILLISRYQICQRLYTLNDDISAFGTPAGI